ncbi:hypothetical protein JCM10295v2_002079 [Rhodotorula toruloides]
MTKPTHAPPPPSKPWLKLILTLVVLFALVYVARLIVLGIQEAMQSTEQALEKQGVSVSKDGVAVKTEKRRDRGKVAAVLLLVRPARPPARVAAPVRLGQGQFAAKGGSTEADSAHFPRNYSGLMKGWKSSQFNVPWMLAKTTGLGGSRHDKNKDEWEKKYGPKQKRRVD